MEIETHQILQRDPRAISRMISRIEQLDPTAFEILSNVDSCTGNAITLGITGAPGAGKSTLVNQLINQDDGSSYNKKRQRRVLAGNGKSNPDIQSQEIEIMSG